jgi:sugar lactone lactonase YvrE
VLLASCLGLIVPETVHGQNLVQTVAGGGPDGVVPALSANLAGPGGVAVDGAGNLYVATGPFVNRVFRMDPAGQLTVVAGSGGGSFSGDGGPATIATLHLLYDSNVAVSLDGSLFIADTNNHRVRRVDPDTGIITTVAGNAHEGYAGDDGPAAGASLDQPAAVALDAFGNLFIADSGNDRIRRVDAATHIITTVAGSGPGGSFCAPGHFGGDGGPATSALLNCPVGVVVDSAGNIFISDGANWRIRRVDAGTGVITTVAGNGQFDYGGDGEPAIAASLRYPRCVAVDARGNLFIADEGNERIRRVDAVTGIITTVAGNGQRGLSGDGGRATDAAFATPSCVAVDANGALFIADFHNSRIRRVDASTGTITTVVGNGDKTFGGDDGPATEASMFYPRGAAVDRHGNIFIADSDNNRIRRVDAATEAITTVAGSGPDGDILCGNFSGDGGPATRALLSCPQGIVVDSAGNLFIADSGNNRIRRVDAVTGIITTVAGSGQSDYSGDGGVATNASLRGPAGVDVDSAGNLFIADTDNHRIRRVDAVTGIITTVAGMGFGGFSGDGAPATHSFLHHPTDVAVDAVGNLYIADAANDRIRFVDVDWGTMTTVAGNGQQGFSGDGGPATMASLNYPVGVSLDALGNVYIADTLNSRIRRVEASTGMGIITTLAGNGQDGFTADGASAVNASLHWPFAVAVAPQISRNVFVVDSNNHRVRVVEAPKGGTSCTSPCVLRGNTRPFPSLCRCDE